MVFPYSCISFIRVWGVSSFGSAAPSAANACHLIHRQWHVKWPFGESPIIMSLAFREQPSDSTVHAISGRNLKGISTASDVPCWNWVSEYAHSFSLADDEKQWPITLLRLYSRERFSHCHNLNKVPEVDTTRQEESKYLKEQISTK